MTHEPTYRRDVICEVCKAPTWLRPDEPSVCSRVACRRVLAFRNRIEGRVA